MHFCAFRLTKDFESDWTILNKKIISPVVPFLLMLSFLISEISRAKNHTLHAHMSINTIYPEKWRKSLDSLCFTYPMNKYGSHFHFQSLSHMITVGSPHWGEGHHITITSTVQKSQELEAHFLHHEQKQILLYQAPLFYSILFPFRTEKKSSLAAARSL